MSVKQHAQTHLASGQQNTPHAPAAVWTAAARFPRGECLGQRALPQTPATPRHTTPHHTKTSLHALSKEGREGKGRGEGLETHGEVHVVLLCLHFCPHKLHELRDCVPFSDANLHNLPCVFISTHDQDPCQPCAARNRPVHSVCPA